MTVCAIDPDAAHKPRRTSGIPADTNGRFLTIASMGTSPRPQVLAHSVENPYILSAPLGSTENARETGARAAQDGDAAMRQRMRGTGVQRSKPGGVEGPPRPFRYSEEGAK